MEESKIKYIKYLTKNDKNIEEKTLFVLNVIGSGGNGIVYKAMLDGYGEVALKEVYVNTDFYEEVRISALNLKYSACIKKILTFRDNIKGEKRKCIPLNMLGVIFDIDKKYVQSGESYYCIYDLIDGSDLYHDVERHHSLNILYSERVTHKYIGDMLLGLNEMAENRIAHRDIKPDNMMIHRGGIKYIDFGFTCIYEECKRVMAGTDLYLAPNIILYNRFDFHKDDIYSLGLTIIYFLSGKDLYDELALDEYYDNDWDDIGEIMKMYFTKLYNEKHFNISVQKLLKGNERYLNMIMNMVSPNPEKRLNISEILKIYSEINVENK